jgi:membrane protease YdiL (CAAX protease family)
MTTMTTTPTRGLDTRALVPFVAVALPVGWVLLSVPLVADLPIEPFVLATLLLGLVAPALLLTRRDPATSIRALLHDCWRVPRPLVLLPALLVIPVTTWAVAGPNGSDVDGGVIAGLTVNIVSSVLIVNVWEEMAWAGFVQRRAALRWGVVGGAVATAAMFTGIHLPLAFYGAHDTSDVLVNVAAMVVAGIGMRFLIAAFDQWGRGSILVLGVLHASFNATGNFLHDDVDWIRYVVTLGLGAAAITIPSVRKPVSKELGR